MQRRIVDYLLKPFGQIRRNEWSTVILMFLYSFLAMTAYNIIKPIASSQFIDDLGADNLPYVQIVAGILIGFIMAGYSWLTTRLPRRWCFAMSQGGIAVILLGFWFLFQTGQRWVSASFYLLGLILAVLLLSQFWTLANLVFDSRQAKRLFGFIGAGSSLGGILGSYLTKDFANKIGTENLILFSTCFMALSIIPSCMVVRREGLGQEMHQAAAGVEKGVSGKEAIRLLRSSKHLRLIALIISFAAIGAVIIDQQLKLALQSAKGHQLDAMTAFLANVQLWTSVIGFVIQIFLTSRIHKHLGIGFALLMLPVSLGSTAIIMLFNPALWAPGLARVVDQSLRYTIDKTTREVLYIPLPSDMKLASKAFVDVTVDRFARGMGSVLLLFLIKPWGLGLGWQRLSYASIAVTAVWIFFALKARRSYMESFRTSIHTGQIEPSAVTPAVADLSTIETLVQELASPDERRVLYAIEFLESLNRRHFITPLLLYHESPAVRARALSVMRMVQPEISTRWLPAIHSMMMDPDPSVRSEAVGALASMHNQEANELVRQLLEDSNSRIALTAAMMLAASGLEADADRADDVLSSLVSNTRDSAVPVRRDFAIAIRHVPIPHFRRLLIPLLNDPNSEVAQEAMISTRKLGAADFIFVPTLISLLRNRQQKSSARELLVGFGEPVVLVLGHFLRDPEEDIWIRRHIPGTLARIPCQRSMDVLINALDEKDGFLRFHVIAALERIHRAKPEITFNLSRIESLIHEESARYTHYRRLHRVLFESQNFPQESLLARALVEKMKREVDRIYRLLGLLYPWKDIAAIRYSIEHGDRRSRAGTLEYLDNILAGGLRKTLLQLLEDTDGAPLAFAQRASVEAAVSRLINDEDPVVASAAIHFVWQQKLSNCLDELDRVMAKPDASDRHVLETASWVLQEMRMPEPRLRMIWVEPLPSISLANQMRNLPLFSSVTLDEIFRICDTGRQVRSDPGRLLCQEAFVPESIQFLLNGRVAVTRPDGPTRQIEAPAVLAFQEVLEDRPMEESVRTTDLSVCLTLTSEEIQMLMADNSDLVPGLFQMLCGDSNAGRAVVKGDPTVRSALPASGNLNSIEKGLVLKTIPIFAQVSPDEILSLASVATEMSLTAGSDLFAEGDPPSIYVLISAQLSIEGGARPPILAGPSDVVGIYQTLAGIAFEVHARVAQDGTALRIEREDLFDLLVQRSALLRQVFAALFRNQGATVAPASVSF
jgi:AAA family ATP:ADP antiporter